MIVSCRPQCSIVYTKAKEETVCFSPLCYFCAHIGHKEFHILRSVDQRGGYLKGQLVPDRSFTFWSKTLFTDTVYWLKLEDTGMLYK